MVVTNNFTIREKKMDKAFENLSNWLHGTLIFLAAMLIIGLISLIVYIVVIYIIDITQTRQAIYRNYPVIDLNQA